ncbi:MAG TPA: HAD-IA family hydrolase [Acidimicrobiales bacterium]|nr:HAD-IA family hydrolase [Acidimicrobiales bacterium]
MSASGAPAPAPVTAVLFDFGGVITDSPFDAFERYEREHGLPVGFIRQVNTTNHLDNAWARLERNEVQFDEFCDAFEAEAELAGGRIDARELFAMFTGALRPEMVEAVDRCRRHFTTGLLTNNFVTPLAASRPARFAEVLAMFDVIVESSVVGVRKPDERFYLLACELLDIEPGEAVFLDDLGVNLKPARALGMATIKVTDTERAIVELEGLVGIPLRRHSRPRR